MVQALCRGRGRSFGPGLKAILASEGSHLSNQESLETLPLRAIPLHEVRGVLGGGGSDFPDRVVKDLAKKAGPGLLYLNHAG